MFGPNHDPFWVGQIIGEDPFINFPRGQVFFGRSRVPGAPEGGLLAYVQPCTVTNAEIDDRVSHGEFSFDVIDEHSTTIWFTDRTSFRLAWSIARQIMAGRKFGGDFSAGMIHEFDGTTSGARLIIDPSAHHIGEVA